MMLPIPRKICFNPSKAVSPMPPFFLFQTMVTKLIDALLGLNIRNLTNYEIINRLNPKKNIDWSTAAYIFCKLWKMLPDTVMILLKFLFFLDYIE